MREVGIHLNYVVITLLQRPFEAGNIGSAKSQFPAAFHNIDAIGNLSYEPFHNSRSAIGTVVVDNKNIKFMLLLKSQHRLDYRLDVLFLIISGDDYYTVAHCYN